MPAPPEYEDAYSGPVGNRAFWEVRMGLGVADRSGVTWGVQPDRILSWNGRGPQVVNHIAVASLPFTSGSDG